MSTCIGTYKMHADLLGEAIREQEINECFMSRLTIFYGMIINRKSNIIHVMQRTE